MAGKPGESAPRARTEPDQTGPARHHPGLRRIPPTGNFAPAISIDATDCASNDSAVLQQARWTRILPSTTLQGNRHHLLEIANTDTWSHLRLTIYPDGGIARLRVYGQPVGVFAEDEPERRYDLVALENGGCAVAWNDAHFGAVANLILLGSGRLPTGGRLETRRRREPGNDWCILQLGASWAASSGWKWIPPTSRATSPPAAPLQAACLEGGTDQPSSPKACSGRC